MFSRSIARRWTLTLNNYSQDDVANMKLFARNACTYAILGFETSSAGTPHLQGFLVLRTRKRLATIKHEIGVDELHLEIARSDVATNREYCAKSSRYWEHGTQPSYNAGAQGEQLTISATRFIGHMDNDEAPLRAYMDQCPKAWLFHGTTMLANYYTAQEEIARANVLALWIHGPTGVGKSKFAHETCPRAYRKVPNTKWWHRYALQRQVIVDDLNLDSVDVSQWLRWLDRYPCSVETKGSEVPLHATLFILTSNYHPSAIFKCNTEALLRRLTVFEVLSEQDFEPIRECIELHEA